MKPLCIPGPQASPHLHSCAEQVPPRSPSSLPHEAGAGSAGSCGATRAPRCPSTPHQDLSAGRVICSSLPCRKLPRLSASLTSHHCSSLLSSYLMSLLGFATSHCSQLSGSAHQSPSINDELCGIFLLLPSSHSKLIGQLPL